MVASYEQLKKLARHMRIPVKQHHVIAYRAHGRVYFRTSARMPHDCTYSCQSPRVSRHGGAWCRHAKVPKGSISSMQSLPPWPYRQDTITSACASSSAPYADAGGISASG